MYKKRRCDYLRVKVTMGKYHYSLKQEIDDMT